ncbi:MAG: hypothetical protein LBK25_01555 [Treponema sp.]|nr:hypothetical protein [Treponema sp.]
MPDAGLRRGVRQRRKAVGVRQRFTLWCQIWLTTWCQTSVYGGVSASGLHHWGQSPAYAGVSDIGLRRWCQTAAYYVVSDSGLLRGVRHRLTTWCQTPA